MNKRNLSNKVNSKQRVLKEFICKIFNVKIFLALFLVVVCCVIVLNPSKYLEATLKGVRVWGTNVLPALFPFMVFSKLLTETGYVDTASKVFSPITKKFFRCSGISSYVLLMSVISGYPLGAKLTADLFNQNKITRAEAHRICSFTSNSGPMFIVGTVSCGMLKSNLAGFVILFSHISGAIINGLIFRKYSPKDIKIEKNFENESKKTSSFSDAIFSSVNSILLVGGFITIFFVLTEVLSSLGVFSPIVKLFSSIGLDENLSNGLVCGLFEMTKGCLFVSCSSASLAIKTAFCSLLISFGGLAISFQCLSFLNDFKISKRFFFLQKTTHAMITFLLCLLIGFVVL